MSQMINIPGKKYDGKEFEGFSLHVALRDCEDAGFRALFMPEIAGIRIDSGKEDRVWQVWYSTISIKVTGRSKQGNAVVVYAHVPNYFSNSGNIENAVNQGLLNGAGVMSKNPKKEFYRLLDKEDSKKVFVVDYKKLKNSVSDVINVSDALKHPQTVPFLGGEEIAVKYLEKHEKVCGNKIGNWHRDDLNDEPVGRLLVVGDNYNYGLLGINYLDCNGRFVGYLKAPQALARKVWFLQKKIYQN